MVVICHVCAGGAHREMEMSPDTRQKLSSKDVGLADDDTCQTCIDKDCTSTEVSWCMVMVVHTLNALRQHLGYRLPRAVIFCLELVCPCKQSGTCRPTAVGTDAHTFPPK